MKKKIIGLSIAASLMLTGIVSASSVWGSYKGNEIIRITVNGIPVKVGDVPAISYNNRTMIPINLLKEAGLNYTWDQKNKTVNIIAKNQSNVSISTENIPVSDTSTRKSLTSKEIAKLMDRVGYIETYNNNNNVIASGSGFLLENGWMVTNHHVTEGSTKLLVKIDGKIYDNKGWYWYDDPKVDIFITQLSTSYSPDGVPNGSQPTKHLNFNMNMPEVGDPIYAIGSPKGLENTVSTGIVSGIRTINGIQYIQHTATIDEGSSGGVLLNEYGEAIGINTWKIRDSELFFAIPMKYVMDAFATMK